MKPFAILAMAWIVLVGGTASAASCRDRKGKFIACPAAAPTASKKCRDAAGKFIKCSVAAVPK